MNAITSFGVTPVYECKTCARLSPQSIIPIISNEPLSVEAEIAYC